MEGTSSIGWSAFSPDVKPFISSNFNTNTDSSISSNILSGSSAFTFTATTSSTTTPTTSSFFFPSSVEGVNAVLSGSPLYSLFTPDSSLLSSSTSNNPPGFPSHDNKFDNNNTQLFNNASEITGHSHVLQRQFAAFVYDLIDSNSSQQLTAIQIGILFIIYTFTFIFYYI